MTPNLIPLTTCTCPQLVDQQFTQRHTPSCRHRHSSLMFLPPKTTTHPDLQMCASVMDSLRRSHARPRLFFFFALCRRKRRTTLSRVSLVSHSSTSLRCSAVRSASTLGGELNWKGGQPPPFQKTRRRQCPTCSAVSLIMGDVVVGALRPRAAADSGGTLG